jgi:hypothetical protein
MKAIKSLTAALAFLAVVLLTSCANCDAQEQLIAQLPPGQRAQAELQLARDKQAARMQVALAVSAATQNAFAPGTALNPYYVNYRGYIYH